MVVMHNACVTKVSIHDKLEGTQDYKEIRLVKPEGNHP